MWVLGVFVAVIKHGPKTTERESGLFVLRISVQHQRKLRQELKAGTEAEASEGVASWLTLQGSLSLLPFTALDVLPRGNTTHSRQGLPTLIINQENVLQPCSQTSLI